MPIYEYRCNACQREFEYQQKMSDPDLTTCEACGEPKLEKLISWTSVRTNNWHSALTSKNPREAMKGLSAVDRSRPPKKDPPANAPTATTPAPAASASTAEPAAATTTTAEPGAATTTTTEPGAATTTTTEPGAAATTTAPAASTTKPADDESGASSPETSASGA